MMHFIRIMDVDIISMGSNAYCQIGIQNELTF